MSTLFKGSERRAQDHCSWKYGRKGRERAACLEGIHALKDELRHEFPRLGVKVIRRK
jgi:hypothetical protein